MPASRRPSLLVAVAAAAALLPVPPAAAADPPRLEPGQIQRAIERARDWLIKQQRPDGSWTAMRASNTNVGATSLVVLALANAGVDADNLNMRRALQWLRTQAADDTYGVALQTMVFAMLSPDADRALIERNAAWLESGQVPQGPTAGAWSYGQQGRGGSGDNSNSQFALLGLHEAARVGVRVQEQTWVRAQQYWVACANADGSWGYTLGNAGGSGSMTCAGIASIWITSEHIGTPDARAARDSVSCCGGGSTPKVLERGLDWLGRRFSVVENPGTPGQTWLYYYLYGLERVGRFTARRYLGEHDWYLEGATMFVNVQDGLTGRFVAPRIEDPIVATSFALLFLAKGRRPVIVTKSRHDPDTDWNRHGHDIAHLVEHVEKRWRKDYPAGLSWHVLHTPSAGLEDFLQAPVFWLSGKVAFELGPDAGPRLRRYLDEGGFIFAEACCPKSGEFDRRFRQLVGEIFPEPEYRLNLLPPEHPAWHAEEIVPPELHRPLLGIDYGCRTCLIYAPPTDARPEDVGMPSLSCLWELGGPSRRALPDAIRTEVDAALAIGTNVLAYATNRSSHPTTSPAPWRSRTRWSAPVTAARTPRRSRSTPFSTRCTTDHGRAARAGSRIRVVAAAREVAGVVEQREDALQRAGHIGPGGRVKHAVHRRHVVRRHDAQPDELGLRPVAGVDLDRQVHELEEDRAGEEGDPQPGDRLERHAQADHEHEQPEAAADVGHADGGVADRHQRESLGVLQRVAGLVGRDPHRRERPVAVDPLREPQHPGPRIVVVGQVPGHGLDLHIPRAGGIEDVAGRRGAREGGRLPGRRGERGVHPPLGPHGQEDGRRDRQHVVGIEVEERHRFVSCRERAGGSARGYSSPASARRSPRMPASMSYAVATPMVPAAGVVAAWLVTAAAVVAGAAAIPAAAGGPADATGAADPVSLCRRIDAVLAHARDARLLDGDVQGAWQVVHGILAFGPDLPLAHDGAVTSALDHLLGGGRVTGWILRPGTVGVLAVVEEGSTMGQGHPDQWLGYLSQCGVGPDGPGGLPLSTPLVVAGRRHTLADLLAQARHDLRPGQEATWTLMAVAAYLPPDATWTSGDGTRWDVERLVRMEAEADIFGAACGGAHRLYGLAAALAARRRAGLPIEPGSGWAEAEAVLEDAIDRARRFQQADGCFSIHSFERPGTSPDVGARLGATGHVFEVLALALDDQRLAEPWVTRAAERLTTLLERTADVDLECGGLYHAAHGLALYRRRICPPDAPRAAPVGGGEGLLPPPGR